MLTKVFATAFKLLPVALVVLLLTGCKPPGPKALLDGKRLLEKGRAEAAVGRLTVATQLLSTNAHAWNYLGIAYHQTGQPSNAVVAYKRALSLNPDLVETRLNLGSLWLELGRTADAKNEFTAYNLRRPNAPEGFCKIALAELQLRETLAAEQHIRRALQLDDRNPESWNTLGLIQLQQRKPHDAARSFGQALSHQADFAPALINLAVVAQQQLGDGPGALKLYRRYLALKPRPVDADQVAVVATLLERELAPVRPTSPPPAKPTPAKSAPPNRPPTKPGPPPAVAATPARPTPGKSVAARPPVPPEPVRQAVTPSSVNAPTAPIQSVEQAPPVARTPVAPEFKVAPVVEVAPPQPATPPLAAPPPPVPQTVPTVAAAAVEERQGFLQKINPANLFRGNDRKLSVTPLPPPRDSVIVSARTPAYESHGVESISAGDRAAAERLAAKGAKALAARRYVEASGFYGAAAKADPSWYQAHFNNAAAAIEAGHTTQAIKASELALALKPDSTEARYNFALALKQAGFYKDAAAQLELVVGSDSQNARAHLTLGNLYADQLQRSDSARVHYLKVLEINPGHPRAAAIHFWLTANPAR